MPLWPSPPPVASLRLFVILARIDLIDLAFRSQHGSVMFSDQHPTVPALLTTREAADRLGLTTTGLHDLRCKDDGLPTVQKGLLVGYQLEDIQAFEQRVWPPGRICRDSAGVNVRILQSPSSSKNRL